MSAAVPATENASGERVRLVIDDGEVAGWRWARAGAPRLLFCHATGFCASAYRAMLAPLGSAFDVLAIDMRGHGRTALPTNPETLRNWNAFARDVGAVLDRWTGGAPVVIAGHSMGAVATTIAARGRCDIRALVLIEPVAVHPALALVSATPLWPLLAARIGLVRGARARRSSWPDRAAVAASYGRKALFAKWAQGALADYLEDGLTDAPNGVRLSCAPAWEAAVFAAQANNFWGALAGAACPVRVLVAGSRDTTVSARSRRQLRKLGADVQAIEGAGHLLPMEDPAATAQFILDAARD